VRAGRGLDGHKVVGEVAAQHRGDPVVPLGVGKGSRPRVWTELVFVAVGYWLYSLIRNAASGHEIAALRRAERILELERALHLDLELAINRAADRVGWLIVGMNYYYATLHIVVTIGVLVWLYRFHPRCYRPARSALVATSGLALVGFYTFALAPPRLLPRSGFIDTVAVHDTWGSMASGDVGAMSNQYAAMPSLHIGWSVWCAIAIIMLARRRWVRVLGGLYPAATLVVILATANHFLIDAVGGLLTLAAGFAVQRLITRGPAYRPGPAGETGARQPPPTLASWSTHSGPGIGRWLAGHRLQEARRRGADTGAGKEVRQWADGG
jgi:hypothetical protein